MRILNKSLLLFVIFIFVSYAQQEAKSGNEVIETAVAKLQQKVLLSEKQANDVKSILTRNVNSLQQSSTRDKALNDAKSKIEGMLDERQKAKYAIVKDDWWNDLSRNISQTAK